MRALVKVSGALFTAAALWSLGPSVAFADGNGATTFTQTDHGVTQVMPDVNPCTGEPGTTTQTFNDVFHVTINKTGSWITGTTTGKIQFVPDNPASPTYTGHFQFWFGDENNLQNDVEHDTSNFRVTGSDGSIIAGHNNAQVAMNANGVITVSFDHFSMTCP
jgi:hypothetical protein